MTNLNDIKIKFVASSGNKKTGNISQTYTSCNSCPNRCPFKNAGCYAKQGPVSWQWKKVEKTGCSPEELKNVVKNSKKVSEVIRHNVAGDIAIPGTDDINESLLNELCDAYKDHKAYSYTHCEVNERNLKLVKAAADKGFVINFSTEDIETAKKVLKAGCNAVIACNTISNRVVKKNDLTIVQCPATIDPEKHCATCGLCWQKDRKVVVAFPVHGNGKKKAKEAGFLSDL